MKKAFSTGAIAGALTAIFGTGLSLGSAYALYISSPEAISVNISGGVEESPLQVTNRTDLSGSQVIDSANPYVFYFDMSMKLDSDSTYTQPNYVAKLVLTVKSESPEALEALRSDSYISLGSSNDLDGSTNYYANENGDSYWQNHRISGFSEPVLSEEGDGSYSMTMSDFIPIPVLNADQDGTEIAEATVNLITSSSYDSTELHGTAYTADVALEEVSDDEFTYAYIAGDMEDSGWGKSEKYLMTPNPKASKYEWMYRTYAGWVPDGTQWKTVVGGTWLDGGDWTWNSADDGKTIYSGSDNGKVWISIA